MDFYNWGLNKIDLLLSSTMPQPAKIWYSFKGGQSSEDNVGYYDPSEFDWVGPLLEDFGTIKNEIRSYLETNEERIKPYFNKALVTAKSRWRTSAFFFWLWPVPSNMKQCPETMKILKKIPGILSAFVSILESDTEIKPHRGDTNAIIRNHLALQVPAGLPECGFMVNEQKRAWKEGQLFMFNDAAAHAAWNLSDQRRYVLLFDVIRPEYKHKKYRVSSMVMAGLLMQSIKQKLPLLKRFPHIILMMMHHTIAFFLNPLLRIRNLFS